MQIEQSELAVLCTQSFWEIARCRHVIQRAIRVALIVGTILAFINHGDKIISLALSSKDIFKILLTYLVPYSVSTWSAVKAIQANQEKTAKTII